MKKVLVLLTLVAAVSAYSQGTVRFSNYGITWSGGTKFSTVRYAAGGPMTASSKVNANGIMADGVNWGKYAQAALYAGAVGSDPATFTLISPAVGFKTDAGYEGYWDDSDAARAISTVAPGANALLQVRVWDTGSATATYEAASVLNAPRYLGASAVMTVTLGGAGTPAGPPAELVDALTGQPLQVINMSYVPVPEPSIIGLGLLGAVAGLFVFRRRN